MIEETDRRAAGSPRLDHVAFAVRDLEAAAALLIDGLGGRFLYGGDHPEHRFRTSQFAFAGDAKVELLQPLGPGRLHEFLDRRGPGVHHVTFTVDDVEVTAQHLEGLGLTTVDTDTTNPLWRETYLGPRQGLGTVLQFGDSIIDWSAPVMDVSLADVLAGRVEWAGARPQLRSAQGPGRTC